MDDKVYKVRKKLNWIIYQICSLILILMVLDVTWQVASRYLLNDPASFTDEAARFLMIWLGMLGGALLFGKGGHLAVTFFTDKLSPGASKVLQYATYILIAFFSCFAMIYGGINLVMRTLRQPSPAMHIPMGYVYCILPIAACFILAYLVLNIIDLKRGWSSEKPRPEGK